MGFLSTLANETLTFISTYLPSDSLANFSQAFKAINMNTIRVLYLRDAKQENSSAIKFAIIVDCIKYDEALGRRVFIRAFYCGADFNAIHKHGEGNTTALNLAAALNKLDY